MMKTEVDITKYKIASTFQIITLAAFVTFTVLMVLAVKQEKRIINIFFYLVGAIVVIFLNKYLHEACHYIVGKIQGFKCEMKFGFKMSECRVDGVQSYKQVIALSLAPLYVYIPVSLLILLSGTAFSLKAIYTGVLCLFVGGMIGDFIYVYEALRNKGGRFTDDGHVLIIEKEE